MIYYILFTWNIPSGGGNWRLGRNLTLEVRQISCVIEDSGEHETFYKFLSMLKDLMVVVGVCIF